MSTIKDNKYIWIAFWMWLSFLTPAKAASGEIDVQDIVFSHIQDAYTWHITEWNGQEIAIPGTRFGITADLLSDTLPQGIEGFHCHCHCESSSFELERTLEHLEEKFSRWFPQLKWLNLGGGHLMTRKDYDTEHLIKLLQGLKARYPHLRIILEPGSAFTWQTGVLTSEVVDIVESRGIKTAILNVSFTCHMPDCLEMPYQPAVRGAEMGNEGKYIYRLGGNSCLSGDYMGLWSFDHELQIGERIVFEDMIHYTMVKTNMFNGIHHPAIALWTKEGKAEIYKQFSYEDYRDRMS